MRRVTLYSRPGCHLCELVERVLHHVATKKPFELIIQDINDDPLSFQKYQHDIPVVTVDGKEVARHRLTASEFEADLDH